eukprot:731911-Pelagomonas_calceolata.AAC.1
MVGGNKIPESQFGFFQGRSTSRPLFILRHLKHAAQTCKPHGSSPLYSAFFSSRLTTPFPVTNCGTTYNNASSLFTFSKKKRKEKKNYVGRGNSPYTN